MINRNLNITKPNDIDDIYKIQFFFLPGKYGNVYCENIITFDIETSTGYLLPNGMVVDFVPERYEACPKYRKMIDEAEPMSLMYSWQCAVESLDGTIKVFLDRTYDSFYEFLVKFTKEMKRQSCFGFASNDRTNETLMATSLSKSVLNLKIEIQNLSFEYQHLRNILNDLFTPARGKQKVFARSKRKPMKVNFNFARNIKIELRDTLVLTQKSLSNWCKDENLPVQKCKPIDYLKIRTPETPLDDEEILYNINDVISMVYGVEKYRDRFGTLNNIPLTQTGIVRRRVCSETFQNDPAWCREQLDIMKGYEYDFFIKLCKLFQGGWTHANATKVGKIYKDVRAFDFASSYPAVMTTRTMPVGEFVACLPSEFNQLASQDINYPDYRWFAKIKVSNTNSIVMSRLQNTYWSLSKCEETTGYVTTDNGRIASCESMTIYLTDLDYDTFKQAYMFDTVEVLELYKAKAGFLSPALINLILDYYSKKTSLKGTGNDSLYTESKQFINSIYGCFVTRIVSDIIEFDDDGWEKTPCDQQTFFDTINELKPEKCFGSFQLGIWVTAWARHNLWDFILKFDEKIIYCDTDSIKGLFTDEDIEWINQYNDGIASIENAVAGALGIDPKLYTPLTSKGKMKRLGIMEREDDAVEFKTLGAKRYCYMTEDGEIHTTIAGLPKKAGTNKIKSVSDFTNETKWNTMESMKNIAVYNDNQSYAKWIDKDGRIYENYDKYGIAIVPTTFDLSISEEFMKFLMTLKNGCIDDDDEFFSDVPYQFR